MNLKIILWGCTLYILACSQVSNETPGVNPIQITELKKETVDSRDEKKLPQLLMQAEKEDKNVFLVFSMKGCTPCKRFYCYHKDSTVHHILSKFFLVQHFDARRSAEGRDLYKIYWKPGFPAWSILDPAGNVIADSGNPENKLNNIGYPGKDPEISYYLLAIRTAAPTITLNECGILAERLRHYGQVQNPGTR